MKPFNAKVTLAVAAFVLLAGPAPKRSAKSGAAVQAPANTPAPRASVRVAGRVKGTPLRVAGI